MADKNANLTSRTVDELHLFGLPWLNSAFQETLLPNGPWQDKVYNMLCEHLAESISRQLDIPERRQIIFEMVGQEFVLKFFPNSSYSPLILESLTPEARKKLEVDACKWLNGAIQKAASATGCLYRSEAELNGEPCSAEMMDFVEHTKQIIHHGLDRHLYLKENEVIKKWEELHWNQRHVKMVEREAREFDNLRQEHNRLKGILGHQAEHKNVRKEDRQNRSSFSTMSASSMGHTTQNVKGALFGSKEDPPLFWGIQSNTIGRSVMDILRRDPRRLAQVRQALHGRQLPGSLRSYVWLDVLLKADRDKLQDSNTEKILRERFAKGVKRGVAELRVTRATHSPISSLIDNTVTQISCSTSAMALYTKDKTHLNEAAKALNILYVYSRSYEPYFVHWLFPLQLAFQDGSGEAEHVYELAMYLNLLNRNFVPKAPEIFATAEKAMSKVKDADPEFYQHMKDVAQINPTINPKEFLVHLIHVERSKAEQLLAATEEGSTKSLQTSFQLLADPLIFLRKWLGEGFVGVLDTQAVIYVWDQLFMQHWALSVAKDFCLALLFLLRNKLLAAHDYSTIKQVFLKEPCKLLTMDLQRAWIHIQDHGDLNEVPSMNRMMPSSGKSLIGLPVTNLSPVENTTLKSLNTVGIRLLNMELIFPKDSMAKLPELSNFEPSKLHVVAAVYFGSVELQSKQSASVPVMKCREEDGFGGLKFSFTFQNEELVFHDLDLSKYDLEQELGNYPRAVLRIDYILESVLTLSCVEVGPLFVSSKESPLTPSRQADSIKSLKWIPVVKEYFCDLNLGQPPDDDSENTENRIQFGGLFGEGSILHINVFDPSIVEPLLRTSVGSQKNVVTDRDTFGIYIDAVTHVPDCASIVKVTGRIVNSGEVDDITDIVALPVLSSSARSPRFLYRLVVNRDGQRLDHGATLLLRVYTLEVDTKELVIVGNCMFDLFDQEKEQVRLGCFTRSLRHGQPQTPHITEDALNSLPRIPTTRVYFRILKHTEAPQWIESLAESGYESTDEPLTESELRVQQSYSQDSHFPGTVRDAAAVLREQETGRESVTSPDDEWIAKKLDRTTHLPSNSLPKHVELSRIVRYRKDIGMNIHIKEAYRLPEGFVVQCAAYVFPQEASAEAGSGIPFCLHASEFDVNSSQRAPKWLEQPTVINPDANSQPCLVIQLHGLNIQYIPPTDHSSQGTVTKRDGQPFTTLDNICLGWTAVPLFQGLFVQSAEHHLPVFRGVPTPQVLTQLGTRRCQSVLASMERTEYMGATLVVSVWDGHFLSGQWPGNLEQIKIPFGDENGHEEDESTGIKISQFILDGLLQNDPNYNYRPSSASYLQEVELFKTAVKETFQRLLQN